MTLHRTLRALLGSGTALAVAAQAVLAQDGIPDPTVDDPTELPAGTYALDPAHSSLVYRISHLGFSQFVGYFSRFDATLQFDPADPEAMRVMATVDPTSMVTVPDTEEWNLAKELGSSETWLDAGSFPEITFQSTAVRVTGPESADVTGDLTMRGVTLPVTLVVTFNGGYASHPYDPGGSRIGFSAEGSLSRSDFGIAYGVPAEGSQIGAGDVVTFMIETEFLRPLDGPATE